MPMCTFDGFVCVTTGMCSEHLVTLFYSPYFTVLLASRPSQHSSLATQNSARISYCKWWTLQMPGNKEGCSWYKWYLTFTYQQAVFQTRENWTCKRVFSEGTRNRSITQKWKFYPPSCLFLVFVPNRLWSYVKLRVVPNTAGLFHSLES